MRAPGAGEFKDILVKVQETKTGSLTIGVGIDSAVGPIFAIVLEERNFDPWRWPTSMANIYEGKAFRGAGQHFRVELYRLPLWPW